MVNDPSGLIDPEVADVCAATGAALVVTHTRARPKQKLHRPATTTWSTTSGASWRPAGAGTLSWASATSS